jgi:hypothetical protein
VGDFGDNIALGTSEASSKPLAHVPTAQTAETAAIHDILRTGNQPADFSLERCFEDVNDIIDDLFNLLPTLLEPQDDFNGVILRDADRIQLQDRQHALYSFPAIEEPILKRLIQANARRRQEIYRLRRESQAKEPARTGNGSIVDDIQSGLLATTPKSARRASSKNRVRGYRMTRISIPSESEGGNTKSTYLSTDFSRKQSESTVMSLPITEAVPVYQPPGPPEKTFPFSCPYCNFEVPLEPGSKYNAPVNDHDWVSHLYTDLRPYICTFENCGRGSTLFGSKEEWLQHELDYHRVQQAWVCGDRKCKEDFYMVFNRTSFETHLKSTHPELVANADIVLLVNSCERPAFDELTQDVCTLCGDKYKDANEWKDHVANHLEQFALTALDKDDAVSEDDSSQFAKNRVLEFVDIQTEMRLEPATRSHKGQEGVENITSLHDPTVVAGSKVGQEQTVVAESRSGERIEGADTANSSLPSNTGDKRQSNEDPKLWASKVQGWVEPEKDEHHLEATLYNVPAQNHEFVGRHEDLEGMCTHIGESGRICVLSGSGGIGKTATAVEYSHRFKHLYDIIILVEAETATGLSDRYNRIGVEVFQMKNEAEQMDPAGLSIAIKERLGKCEKRWLIIFDNVESWKDIYMYIPSQLPTTKGSVLITTRDQGLIQAGTLEYQRLLRRPVLKPLSPEESGQFLLCSIDPKLEANLVPDHPDYKLAVEISEKVERLPLALIMVSGFVRMSRTTLEDFLEFWEEKQQFREKQAKRNKLVTEGQLATSIDLLWDIGISELTVDARNLLEILALLDPESIPKDLLIGDHEEEYLEFLNNTEIKKLVPAGSRKNLLNANQNSGTTD